MEARRRSSSRGEPQSIHVHNGKQPAPPVDAKRIWMFSGYMFHLEPHGLCFTFGASVADILGKGTVPGRLLLVSCPFLHLPWPLRPVKDFNPKTFPMLADVFTPALTSMRLTWETPLFTFNLLL